MVRILLATLLVLACNPAVHAEDYQKLADATAWKFSQEQAGVADALLRFSRDFQVELIRPKNKFGDIIIRVVEDGKELISFTGHYRTVFRSSGNVLIYADYMPTRTGCSVMWTKGQRTWNAKDSLAMTEEERGLGSALSKLALNVCLIATAYGVRNLGPANPSHYERLKKYAKLARKRGQEQQAKADLELRLAPVKYAFAQEVTLFHREPGSPSEGNGNGGWTVSPHWRRGHWRWQACGQGRQERRRVAIPSVLVNSHLFLGAAGDTTATYRMGKGVNGVNL